MEYPPPWTYAVPEPVYNPSSSMNVSSYFARPNKVVKPSSRSNSPRSLGRRRTTTSATMSSRTRSVVDHLRSTHEQYPDLGSSRSRPVSWHPNSMDTLNIPQNISMDVEDLSAFTYSTTQINGLVTPISYPAANEPQIQELITPLDEFPATASLYPYENQQYESQVWLGQDLSKVNPYAFDTYCPSTSMHPSWQFNQPSNIAHAQTAPPSPDCLPHQGIGFDNLSLDTTSPDSKDNSEELVGMGLYDSPADVQTTSMLFGTDSNVVRKSLKLEESFEPDECEDAEEDDSLGDDQDDEDDQNDAEEEDDDEFPVPERPEYSSQSIASHMPFQSYQEPDPIASKYLATLSQLNSAYYPTSRANYGWI